MPVKVINPTNSFDTKKKYKDVPESDYCILSLMFNIFNMRLFSRNLRMRWCRSCMNWDLETRI